MAKKDREKAVVIASVLPFAQDVVEYNELIRRTTIRLRQACLLHPTCTLSTTAILRNPYLRRVVLDHLLLIKEGVLVLDRRAEARSFGELAQQVIAEGERRFSPSEQLEIHRTAFRFDDLGKTPLGYSANNMSGKYRARLLAYLQFARGDPHFQTEAPLIDRIEKKLTSRSSVIGIAFAENLVSRKSTLFARAFRQFALLAYCEIGAIDLGANLQVPAQVALVPAGVSFRPSPADISGLSEGYRVTTKLDEIHALVLRKAHVAESVFESLSPETLLDLRQVTFVQQAFDRMRRLEAEIDAHFQAKGLTNVPTIQEHKEHREEVESSILRWCRKEHLMSKIESGYDAGQDYAGDIVDEALDVGVPFAATARRLGGRLAFTALRKSVFAWSSTPIRTYIDFLKR